MSVHDTVRAALVEEAMHMLGNNKLVDACRLLTKARVAAPNDKTPWLLLDLSLRAAAMGLSYVMFKALEPLKQQPSDDVIGICVTAMLAEDKIEQAMALARNAPNVSVQDLLLERAEVAFERRAFATARIAFEAAGLEPPIDRLIAYGTKALESGDISYGRSAYAVAERDIPRELLQKCRLVCICKGDVAGFTTTLELENRTALPAEWSACGHVCLKQGDLSNAFKALAKAYEGQHRQAAGHLLRLLVAAAETHDYDTAFKTCNFLLARREAVPIALALGVADALLRKQQYCAAFMLYDFILALETP